MIVWLGLAVGCGGIETAAQPPQSEPPLLVRRDPEPAGKNCPFGGTAIRTGLDSNRDGVLGGDEIVSTTYVCGPSTMLLIRRDLVTPGLNCPVGGTAVQTGIDDNGDGVLEDTEIDQTTLVCNSLEIWDGDFPSAAWADPVKVAALQGARVVTGSLQITADAPVALPMLEIVGGDLLATSRTPSVTLPTLRVVAGAMEIDSPAIDGSFAALERVGGAMKLSSSAASIDAPKLHDLGGDLVFLSPARGKVSMPALTSVGGALKDWAGLTALQLGQLASIGRELLLVDPTLPSLSLPALNTIGGDLNESGHLMTLELGALRSIGGRLIPADQVLTRFALPALKTIGGDLLGEGSVATIELPQLEQLGGRLKLDSPALTMASMPSLIRIGGSVEVGELDEASVLAMLDLGALDEVDGSFMVANAPALVTLLVSRLRTVKGILFDDQFDNWSVWITRTALQEIDLGSLSVTTGGIATGDSSIGNPSLRTVRLDSLSSAPWLAFTEPGLETITAPVITTLSRLNINDNHTIRTLDFRRLAHVTDWMMLDQTSLADLSGFPSLVSVQFLDIFGDDQLRDLRGLSSLEQLSSLELDDDSALTSLDGLEQVTEISGFIDIEDNIGVLTSVAGLRNVTSVGSILIEAAPELTSLDLSSLRTVGGRFAVVGLQSVTSLSGLAALTSVGGNFGIEGLPSLTSLAGLDALVAIGGFVDVQDVPNVPFDELVAFYRRFGRIITGARGVGELPAAMPGGGPPSL